VQLVSWQEWLDIETLKTLSRHTSGCVFVLLSFWLIGWFVKVIVPEGTARWLLDSAEVWVLLGLFGWLILQMVLVLWKGRVRLDGPHVLA
jgi:hypothetical protein